MARRYGGEKPKRATGEVPKAPSILDRINLNEIDIKITRIVEKLRGPDGSIISRAVTNRAVKLLERNPKMINFVGGGHRYTLAEARWACRTEVEADFLRSYLQEVMKLYDGYFKRLEIKLSSRQLEEVWAKGIKLWWDVMLHSLEDDLNGIFPGDEPSLLQGRMHEFDKRTGHTLRDAENEWHEKVEEAVSVEQFGQRNSEIALVGKSRGESADTTVLPLSVAPGAIWKDLCIMMREHAMQVEVKGKTEDRTFQEAGFEEKRRRHVADRLWHVLQVLAIRGGVLPFDEPKLSHKVRLNIKQNISQLRKRLKALIPIEGDPFEPTRKGREYRSRFKISTSEGLLFPTPGETTWDKVAIEEMQSGLIRFSVNTFERFSAFSNDEEEVARLEAALRDSCIEREYELRSLGLAMPDGSPDPRGLALLAVLKAGGRVKRNSDDEAMLSLCKFLSNIMQIEGSPFQYSASQGLWIANFEACSHTSPDRR
jgi:hypothetical protein